MNKLRELTEFDEFPDGGEYLVEIVKKGEVVLDDYIVFLEEMPGAAYVMDMIINNECKDIELGDHGEIDVE